MFGFRKLWLSLIKAKLVPETQALIPNGQNQAAGVLECIHFLVENALTDHFMRFVAFKDKNTMALAY